MGSWSRVTVVVAAAVGTACGNSDGGGAADAGRQTWGLYPITADFNQAKFATTYTAMLSGSPMPPTATFTWTLKLTLVDPEGAPDPSTPGSGATVDPLCNNMGVGVADPVVDTQEYSPNTYI